MSNQITYALQMAWQYRDFLKRFCHDSHLQIKSILELDLSLVKKKGIRALILDMDGVLTAYGDIQLEPPIALWLKNCIEVLGKDKVFILSNRPKMARLDYFHQTFQGVNFIMVGQKKPYPAGIEKILQMTQLKPNEVLIVDDRLLTGILAAGIAQVQAFYVTKPLINFRKRPVKELFFIILRVVERFILAL